MSITVFRFISMSVHIQEFVYVHIFVVAANVDLFESVRLSISIGINIQIYDFMGIASIGADNDWQELLFIVVVVIVISFGALFAYIDAFRLDGILGSCWAADFDLLNNWHLCMDWL